MVDIVELPVFLTCGLETRRRRFRFDVAASELGDGNVDRNLNPDFAWYRWELQMPAGASLTTVQANELEDFLLASRAGAYAFLFEDPFRKTATDQVIGTSDGSTSDFQLYSVHSNTVRTYLHPIKHPTAGTVSVSIASSPVSFTLGDGGVVTVTDSPVPAGSVTASFDWRHAVIVEPGSEVGFVAHTGGGWRFEPFAAREVIEA